MKIIGKIVEIQDAQQVSETFKKRSFVLEYAENPQYAEYISFETIQDKCSLLDNFHAGQEVEVSFNLRGRKWINPEGETRYFNTLQAWRLDSLAQGSNQPTASGAGDPSNIAVQNNEENALPF
jgi:hypothetical protein